MDFIWAVWEFLKENGGAISALLLSIVAFGKALAVVIPGDKDDAIINRVIGVIQKLLGFIPGPKK